ncbi:MAG: hypothetical protein LBM28_02460 [Oscillospiraceae bacterium]|jgi:dipicolinate synthase subunit A|nr:hypothetical protein [Oscillospiraceae bacterium]
MADTYHLICGDARQRFASRHLIERGFRVRTYGVPAMQENEIPAQFGQDDILILPFPSFQGLLFRGKFAIAPQEILHRVGSGCRVFGGILGNWKGQLEAQGALVTDLYGSEPLTTANAVPTAEGAIQLAMERSEITIHGARCLVIGYGRVGSVLAQKLHALCAQVTVCARNPAQRAAAQALGMHTDEPLLYRYGLHQYDFVFNSVPDTVISEDQLAKLSPNCRLFELASKPGGIPEELCYELGLSYHFAPGLPGLCAPATAGARYAESVLQCVGHI